MQSATAFQAIHDALSFFRNAYDAFASYRAALIRLDGLMDTIEQSRMLPRLAVGASLDDARATGEDVDVRTPDGQPLIRGLDVRPRARRQPGDHGAVGQRQDDAAGEPRRPVAVRLGRRATCPSTARETMFLSAAALPSAR